MQYITHRIIPMFEGFCRKSDIDGKEISASISGTPIKLIVAANDNTKARGLMDSDEPHANTGMIFIYENPSILDFWMKNVNYALDILFFDADMNMVDSFTMDPYNGESDENLKIYKKCLF